MIRTTRFSAFTSIMLTATLLALAGYTHAITPLLHIKGSKFFTPDGDQWFSKGVAYQHTPRDPLINNTQCRRDAELIKNLGANSIGVYQVDPQRDHDACMETFEDAGIYLFLDLDHYSTVINQFEPIWSDHMYDHFRATMDAFHKYPNVAGFFVGDKVITQEDGSRAAPFIKAVVRDMKAYRDAMNYRDIPIGYANVDVPVVGPTLQNYLVCGNPEEQIDFYALNPFRWSSAQTFEDWRYAQLTKQIEKMPIPVLFSETGCNPEKPRDFSNQMEVFGDQVSPYWSGAIVHKWIEETDHCGLVSYGPFVSPDSTPFPPPDGFPREGNPEPVNPDFFNLQEQWAKIQPVGVFEGNYTALNPPIACPVLSRGWDVDPQDDLPARPAGLLSLLNGIATASWTVMGSWQNTGSKGRQVPGFIPGTLKAPGHYFESGLLGLAIVCAWMFLWM